MEMAFRSSRLALQAAKPQGTRLSRALKGVRENEVRQGAFTKPLPVTRQMKDFVGVSEISRTDVLRKIWAYIKQNDLQDPKDKRQVRCDDNLKRIFSGKDRIHMFEMSKLINQHFVKE